MLRTEAAKTGSRLLILRYCLCCAVIFLCFPAPRSRAAVTPRPLAQGPRLEVKEDSTPSNEHIKIYGEPRRSFHRKGEDLVKDSGKSCTDCHVSTFYPGKDFFRWEHKTKWEIHWIVFSVALFVMMTGIYASASIWRKGESPSLHHPAHWPSIGRALFWDVFLGRRVWRQSRLRWTIFFFISMSFIELFFVFVAILVTRYLYPTTLFTTGPGAWVLDFLADLLGLMILAGTMLALYRRYILREPHLESQAEDVGILWMLLAIVVTGFFLEACRLAVVPLTPQVYASFVGVLGAGVLKSWGIAWTGVRFYVWFIHAVLVFVFFAYLPFSKLFHVITCPASILATASEAAYKERQ